MSLVKVKEKFQVTIPIEVRNEIGLEIGDLLEAIVEGKKIVLKPKTIVDREKIETAIAKGIKAYEEGRVTPAFDSMEEFEDFLRSEK